jgi:hypothetical protein
MMETDAGPAQDRKLAEAAEAVTLARLGFGAVQPVVLDGLPAHFEERASQLFGRRQPRPCLASDELPQSCFRAVKATRDPQLPAVEAALANALNYAMAHHPEDPIPAVVEFLLDQRLPGRSTTGLAATLEENSRLRAQVAQHCHEIRRLQAENQRLGSLVGAGQGGLREHCDPPPQLLQLRESVEVALKQSHAAMEERRDSALKAKAERQVEVARAEGAMRASAENERALGRALDNYEEEVLRWGSRLQAAEEREATAIVVDEAALKVAEKVAEKAVWLLRHQAVAVGAAAASSFSAAKMAEAAEAVAAAKALEPTGRAKVVEAATAHVQERPGSEAAAMAAGSTDVRAHVLVEPSGRAAVVLRTAIKGSPESWTPPVEHSLLGAPSNGASVAEPAAAPAVVPAPADVPRKRLARRDSYARPSAHRKPDPPPLPTTSVVDTPSTSASNVPRPRLSRRDSYARSSARRKPAPPPLPIRTPGIQLPSTRPPAPPEITAPKDTEPDRTPSPPPPEAPEPPSPSRPARFKKRSVSPTPASGSKPAAFASMLDFREDSPAAPDALAVATQDFEAAFEWECNAAWSSASCLSGSYESPSPISILDAADGFFVEDIEESEAAAVRGLQLRRSSKERLLSLLSPRRRAGRALLFGDRVLAV